MTEKTESQKRTLELLYAGLAARKRKEKRFIWLGRCAIGIALFFLATLFISIGTKRFSRLLSVLRHIGSVVGQRTFRPTWRYVRPIFF